MEMSAALSGQHATHALAHLHTCTIRTELVDVLYTIHDIDALCAPAPSMCLLERAFALTRHERDTEMIELLLAFGADLKLVPHVVPGADGGLTRRFCEDSRDASYLQLVLSRFLGRLPCVVSDGFTLLPVGHRPIRPGDR